MALGKAAREHVVVCVGSRMRSTKLVRRGYRIAKRLQGDLDVVYVRVPGARLGRKEEAALQDVYDLARNPGGKVVELEGDSVADELVKYATGQGATVMVMGQSARSRLQEILRGSIINRIMRETRNIDIVIVADSGEQTAPAEPAP